MKTKCSSEVLDAESEPKYVVLANDIRGKIRSGALRPGDRLPSQRELGAQWGVSRSTVDRMYRELRHGKFVVGSSRSSPVVADMTSPRVSTGMIGFAWQNASSDETSYCSDPYWSRLVSGVAQAVAEQNKLLAFVPDGASVTVLAGLDGIVFPAEAKPETTSFLPRGMPAVFLMSGDPDHSSVVADDFAGIQASLQHLLYLGHRRIGYVRSLFDGPIEQRRCAAYYQTLRAAGIVIDAKWITRLRYADDSGRALNGVESGSHTMRVALSEGWLKTGCTAVIAQNDEAAIGIIEALKEAGVCVPEEISVVGFDGTEISTYFKPQLTTVQLPLREIGRQAGELLLRRIETSQAINEQIVLPVQLKVRASTAPVNYK